MSPEVLMMDLDGLVAGKGSCVTKMSVKAAPAGIPAKSSIVPKIPQR